MKIIEVGKEYVNLESNEFENQFFDSNELELLNDSLLEFIYYSFAGQQIFEPLLKTYNKIYHSLLTDKLNVEQSFNAMAKTDWWEQYMINNFQFSGAKSLTEQKLLKQLVFDENHKVVSYSKFKEAAQPYLKEFNVNYFNVEHEMCLRSTVMINQWNDIERTKDIFPYWIYRTRLDPKVRDEHRILEGKKFKIGSFDSDRIFAPNGWNCRCYAEKTDNKVGVYSESKVRGLMNTPVKVEGTKNTYRQPVPVNFQHNVAIDGIFSLKGHSYGEALSNINKLNHTNFNESIKKPTKLDTTNLTENQKYIVLESNSHKSDYVFQNKQFMLNVILKHGEVNKMQSVHNIKKTIEQPSEIWAQWNNEDIQKVVKMNYLSFDKEKQAAYIVETEKGTIKNAYFLKHYDSINERRIGLKLLL